MSESAPPAKPPTTPAMPPTPQDVKRRLSVLASPIDLSVPGASSSTGPASPSFTSPGAQYTLSSSSGGEATKKAQGYSSALSSSGMSSTSEDEGEPLSPRPAVGVPLSAISEADDLANLSGTDSDASSEGGEQRRGIRRADSAPSGTMTRALERLRISRESTRLSESVASKSGYLMKKGERRKAWKKRWFVLRGGQLAMYKNEKEYRLLRLIPLSEIHTCSPIELKKHAHTFGIVTPKRTYYVKADSDQGVREWCQAIQRAKHDLASSTTVTSWSETPTPGDVTPHASGARSPNAPRSATIPPGPSSGLAHESSSLSSAIISSPELQPIQTMFAPSPAPTNESGSILSSSYTSGSSMAAYGTGTTGFGIPGAAATITAGGKGGAIAPPNSFVPGAGGALGLQGEDGHSLELGALDAGIERAVRRQGSSQPRSGSVASTRSSLANESLVVPGGDYFARSRSATTGSSHNNPPLSPGGGLGGVSSSEDEDGFDTYDAGWPSATAAAAPLSPSLAQHHSQLHQQKQQLTFADQQQPHPQRLAPAAPISPSPSTPGGFGDPNKVILSGYLMKQGKRKNWRKRWFVLMSGRLMYSRSHMDAKIHRQIPLTRILDAIEHDGPIAGPTGSSTTKRHSSTTPGPIPPSPMSMPHTSSSGGGHGAGDRGAYEHCFKIITPKRTFLVCAPTEEDEIKWLAALQCLVQRKNGTSGGVVGGAPTTPNLSGFPPTMTGANEGKSVVGPPSAMRPGSAPGHARKRSVTDAAREAVHEVERRYHPHSMTGKGLGQGGAVQV